MGNRLLSGLVLFFGFALGVVLLVSDRSLSRVMESFGGMISQALGF